MIQAVLASDMQEAHSCTVTLECPTVTVGLSLVLYLVAGLVAVKPDDIFDLLGVANRYSMPTLVSYIEYTLVRQLNMENLCTLLMYAAEYSMNVLQECCTCMALKHYEKFVEMAGPYNSEDAPDNSGECREGDDFPTTTVPKEVLENIHNMRRNKMVLFNETIPTHSANSEH